MDTIDAGDREPYVKTKKCSCAFGGSDCAFVSLQAVCDPGDVVTGGGALLYDDVNLQVRSLPVINAWDRPLGGPPDRWDVRDADGILPDGWTVTVRANCASAA